MKNGRKGYNHDKTSKEEHEKEIRCAATKGTFFQHTTITIGKDYIKNKIKSYWSKIHEVCNKPPDLKGKDQEKS